MFIKVIPQGHCVIVERFRKPVRVAGSGVNLFIPFLDSACKVSDKWGGETCKESIFVELTEQIKDTSPRPYYTKDNVQVYVDCMYRWRVLDPIKAYYEVDHLHTTLTELVLSEIRTYVGSHELNELLSSRRDISERVVAALAPSFKKWGVSLVSADIQDLSLDAIARDTMRRQLEAARESEAMKISAEGDSVAMRTTAEGNAFAVERYAEAEKKAAIMRAEGESQSTKLTANAEEIYLNMLVEQLGVDSAARVFIAQKTQEAYGTISSAPAKKVYMQSSMMPVLNMLENKTEK